MGIDLRDKNLTILGEGVDVSSGTSSINFEGSGVNVAAVGDNVTVTIPGGGSSPYNSFNYNISNLVAAPTSGKANFNVSEGDIFGIRINYETLDAFFVTNYITSGLNGSALLINIPANASSDSIFSVSNFVDNSTYCTFDLVYLSGNTFPTAGLGTLTFIPYSSLINTAILKHDGPTYDTNAIQTVTAAEYMALTPVATTIYFVV